MDLTGRVAIITGGKRIGRVVARELAGRGADLVLSYRGSHAEAAQTAAEVEATGRKATLIAADVSQPSQCAAIVEHAVSALGRVDVLINMASIYAPTAFDALTDRDWDVNLAVNLSAAFHCARAAVPHMRRAGGGRIINFAALELAADNILVNAIAPGPIVAPPDLTPEENSAVAEATPVGRWGGEMEIAKAVQLLIDTDFITGETIRVDGGRHVR
jgi:NAD(P)-dependent dehydrogenase (short-subunit alcohol dehydrogenase family)